MNKSTTTRCSRASRIPRPGTERSSPKLLHAAYPAVGGTGRWNSGRPWVLWRIDDDLSGQFPATSNAHPDPSLNWSARVGPRLDRSAVVDLLTRYQSLLLRRALTLFSGEHFTSPAYLGSYAESPPVVPPELRSAVITRTGGGTRNSKVPSSLRLRRRHTLRRPST